MDETLTPPPAAQSSADNRPLIQGNTPSDRPKRQLTLWINKHASQANKAPDVRGELVVTDARGRDVTIGCAGWLRQDEGKAPRLTLLTDPKSEFGGMLLGSVRAMINVKGQPADGRLGLQLIGNLDVPNADGNVYRLTVTGEMNTRFRDRGVVVDSALSLGFPQAMIDQFLQLLAQKDAERARQAVDGTSQLKSMQP